MKLATLPGNFTKRRTETASVRASRVRTFGHEGVHMRNLSLSLSVLLSTATAGLTLGGCERTIYDVNGGDVYLCGCAYTDTIHGGGDQNLAVWVCADSDNKTSTCHQACISHGAHLVSVEGPDGGCPEQPGTESYELAGEEPNSSEAEMDPGDSRAYFAYNGDTQDVAMMGSVTFTGGCEGSSCPITFDQMSFTSDTFSVPDGSSSIPVSSIRIMTVGDMIGSQSSDGSFTIPYDQIQVLIHASVDGASVAAVFSPAPGEDLTGYYIPSTGLFGLSGWFASDTESLELQLHGAATSRAPVADAGSAQTVTANGTGVAGVTLDGSGSYDLDGDLVEIHWYEGVDYLSSDETPYIMFPIGEHTLTAIVFDSLNKSNTATTTVRVVAP